MLKKQTFRIVLSVLFCLLLLIPSIPVLAEDTPESATENQVVENTAETETHDAEQTNSEELYSTVPVTIKIKKQWKQADGEDLLNPETSELEFLLFADNILAQDFVVAATSDQGEWSQVVENLPYQNPEGKEVDYHIQEVGEVNGVIELNQKKYSVTIEKTFNKEKIDTEGVLIEFVVTNQVIDEVTKVENDTNKDTAPEQKDNLVTFANADGYNGKKVTFVGQWTSESTRKVDTEKTFTAGSDKLGAPVVNQGLLRSLAKTFLGWSDQPQVGNGKWAEGARLFSAEDTIETVFPDGIPEDAKIYGIYFSLNAPDQPLSNWDFLSFGNEIDKLPLSNNKIIINKSVSEEDTLPNTKLKVVNGEGTIIDYYKEDQVNEVVLNAEFEMDPTVAMLVYKNPIGSNALKPILSYDYDSRYQTNNFSTAKDAAGYTYVDLNVELDPQLTIPPVLYVDFSSYSWRPLYVLDQNQNALEIIDPYTEASLGNNINSFSSLVSNTNPSTLFGVNLNGNTALTIRVVLRNGAAEKITEANITPGQDGTVPGRILENIRLKALTSDDLKGLYPNKSQQEISASVVSVPDALAKELADNNAETNLKISGSIEGNVVASAGSFSLGFFTLQLRHEEKIAVSHANTLAITYTWVNLNWSKVWEDDSNKYGYRPQDDAYTVIVNKTVDGVTTEYGRYDKNTTMLQLPGTEDGKLITWSLDEVDIPNYTKVITPTQDPDTYIVTNKVNPPKTEFTVKAVWNDYDNAEKIRPHSLTVQLYENGVALGEPVLLPESGTYTWTNLNKYNRTGVYTVREINEFEGYTTSYQDTEIQTTITSTLKPVKADYTVNKEWVDGDNQDGLRPAQFQVQLYQNGVAYGPAQTISSTDNTYTWSDLEKYNATGPNVYTLEELNVDPNYAAKVETNGTIFKLTNTYYPELITIEGTKTWDDANNQDGLRPEKIKVLVKQGDDVVAAKEVTAADNWEYHFDNLRKLYNGVEIVYTIDEEAVPGYEKRVDGYNLTNIHKPAEEDIKVVVNWVDSDNKDNTRPKGITVNLYQNDVKLGATIISQGMNWINSYLGLPEYLAGQKVTYTLKVQPVEGYDTTVGELKDGVIVVTNILQQKPDKPSKPTEPSKPALPNTGMTSTIGLGITFLAAGIVMTLSKKKENE